MRTKSYQVYAFDELSDEAKETAVADHIQFWLETFAYEQAHGNFKRALDKAEAMQTPWFVGSYVYDYCKDEIIEEIKLNEYEFREDGTLD